MSKFRGKLVSGSFITGNSNVRGLANIASGTAVATVSATGVASGDTIQLTPYMYTNALATNSLQGFAVGSVQAGQFMIFSIGSKSPNATLPIAWTVVE